MKKFFVVLLLLAVVAGLVFLINGKKAAGLATGSKGGDRPITVELGTVRRGDVAVWLTGIGSVQASQSVTVRPRVGGVLTSVDFKEGAAVEAGEVLARIDPRPYEAAVAQAEAKKAQDETQLSTARVDAARLNELLRQNAVAKQQVDQANALTDQLEALVKADEAAVRAAKLDVEFTTMRSPISGITGVRQVDAGNIVTASQAEGIVVVAQMQPAAVVFSLPQRDLAALMNAMGKGGKRPKVEALDESGKVLDAGVLDLVDNQIDVTTGTLRLKASFPNEHSTLWPGRFVSARVLVDTIEDALLVPRQAVQPGLEERFVYAVKADETVEVRDVETGRETGGDIVIQSGLKEGERIVLSGQIKLQPGMKVTERKVGP
ncbi:MAG: efflux RND transporter periplasmic adaptor subunit [Verrucomicrobiota bacterium]